MTCTISINPQFLDKQLILNPDFNTKERLPRASLFLYPTSISNFNLATIITVIG